MVGGEFRGPLQADAVFIGLDRERDRRDFAPRQERVEGAGWQALFALEALLQRGSVQVKPGEGRIPDLTERVVEIVGIGKRALCSLFLEAIEGRLAVGESRPAFDLASDDRLVGLRQEIIQLLSILGLRETDELALAGEVEADDVRFQPERGPDVALEVDSLVAQLVEEEVEAFLAVRELRKELKNPLPLVRFKARVDGEEELGARRRNRRAGRS
jgi:hypothetical protein